MSEPESSQDADTAACWRLEVGRFRAEQQRRTFPLTLHVGVPAGPRVSAEVPWPVPREYDDGLRFDLLTGLVERWGSRGDDQEAPGVAWLTRMGFPEPHDQDLAWHAAAVRALAAQDRHLAQFRVVTKNGWLDVRTGERRVWRRLRL